MEQPQAIWEYRSNPPHLLNWDVAARTIVQPFSHLLADGVIAHFYDWINIPRNDYRGEVFEPDPQAFSRKTFLDGALVDMRWGWQRAFVMSSINPSGWHFAYHIDKENQESGDFDPETEVRKCRIIIPENESIKFLIGDKPVRIFALDMEGNELSAKFYGPITRNDPAFKNARLI